MTIGRGNSNLHSPSDYIKLLSIRFIQLDLDTLFIVWRCEKVTLQAHLSGAFCVVTQSRWNPIAPSFHHKNHSEICDLSVNKYWGTGSEVESVGKFGTRYIIHALYY